ncbi:hypothetical protein AVEN_253806-1 [Araneus ventricosus]|uniref:Uncharacterized protein n=1 Tax=Araneus ventricosus TaxID=182803 RepID=A0A4Y2T9A5_ARAVE|nr:hypothetical protein AVEN_253806-1 [Araneus ventricosus]
MQKSGTWPWNEALGGNKPWGFIAVAIRPPVFTDVSPKRCNRSRNPRATLRLLERDTSSVQSAGTRLDFLLVSEATGKTEGIASLCVKRVQFF